MPIYNVKAPDGKTYKVQGPENADEGALIETLHNYLSTAKAPAPQPSTNRTALEAVTDVPAALLKGAAGMAQFPGQVYGLATGDFDTAAMRGPQKAQDFAESLKSQGLKAREAQQASIIAEAAKNGVISEGVAAVASTIKDPALFVSFIAEQVPQLLPALLTGGAYTALSTGARQVAKYGTKEAAEAAARAGAARVALGTGIAQQGADVGTDTYKEALDLAEKQYPGMSLEDRQALALSKARATAGEAGIISLLAQRLPGGRAIERRMAGLPGEGRIRSALGEAASEMIEEGGGKFASNVNLQQIDPTRSLTQGVGQAAGLGAIGGGVLGGVIGQSAPAEPLQPGQRQGEGLEQTAIRLQQEILNAQAAISNLQQGTQDPSVQIAQANNELVELAANNKPLAIADQIRASQAPADQAPAVEPFVEPAQPFAAAEPTVAAAPVVEPAAPVAVPEQPAAVSLPEVPGNVSNVSGVNQFTQPIQGEQDVTKPVAQPSGGSPAATVESVENAPTPSAGRVDRSGVVPAGQDVGVTVSGEGNAPAAVKAPSYEPLLKLPDVVSTFKTERGSTYALHSDNTTTRNRSGVDSPDTTTGLQQRSAKTVFLTPENVDVIGGVFQNADIATELVPEVKNGKPTGELQLKLTEDYGPKKAGEVLYTVPYQTTPSVGLSPVEVYSQASPKGDDGRGIHFGTAITEVNATDKAPTKTVPTEEAPATQTVEAPQEPVQEEVTALNEEAQVVLDKINQAIEGAVAPDAPKGYTFNLQGKSFRIPGSQPALLKFKNTTLLKEFPNIFKAGPVVPPAQPKAESLRQKEEIKTEAPKETLAELEQQKAENTKNIEAEIVEKKAQLVNALKTILARMGLKDVSVNLIEDIKSEEEGSYADRLMRIAVDANDPLRVLKHETVHALKELGFFTDSQWKSLTSQANSKWIEKYLKGRNVELDGKTMSRYDAYMVKYNGNMDMIVEEAIADAFGDFSVKAPPGMLAAITARMKMLFQGIKSALNGTGFYTSDQIAEQIFTKVAKGKLKAGTQATVEAEEPAKLSLRAPKTEAFKDWFGDSKVVDDKGEPVVMYHGTSADFDIFKDIEGRSGFYFTSDKKFANSFAEGEGANVVPVYLSIKKPADLRRGVPKSVYKDLENQKYSRIVELTESDPKEIWNFFDGDSELANVLKSAGYDGARLSEPAGRQEVFSWMAFKPTQIKSATGNKGTYSKTNPDIRYSLRAPKTEAFKNWFGDSKVADKDGSPMVMYHGTTSDFDQFDTEGFNAHFGNSPEQANDRLLDREVARQGIVAMGSTGRARVRNAVIENANVIPAYLSISKPLRMKDVGDWRNSVAIATELLGKRGISRTDVEELLEEATEVQESYEFSDLEPEEAGAPGATPWNTSPENARFIDELRRMVEFAGYDGIVYKNEVEGSGDAYIAFEPEQIKSATGNIGTYDVNKPDIRYSLRDKLGMYSELENKIEAGSNKAPAASWKAYINGLTQKGVKPDEIEWSGVKDWLDLQKGTVTKDELVNYLKEGGVKVEEVVLENRGATEFFVEDDDGNVIAEYPTEVEAQHEQQRLEDERDDDGQQQMYYVRSPDSVIINDTKYGTYTLPGGENYREVLLTLPNQEPPTSFEWTSLGDGSGSALKIFVNGKVSFDSKGKAYPADKVDEAEKQALRNAGVEPTAYRSSHWDQPNVLAHIRVNDRTDADGNKVLFVEEIQSDWGQEGKKKGFKPTAEERAKNKLRIDDLSNQIQEIRKSGVRYPEEGTLESETDPKFIKLSKLMDERVMLQSAERSESSLPPAAPFVGKTEGWLNLALKRIMVMAAEGGYDKVAFVNGKQSADRYDLSKQIQSIKAEMDTDGTYIIYAKDNNGSEVLNQSFSATDLPNAIGQELADKVISDIKSEATPAKTYSGLDLKVGGEGMKTFYDTIVPNAVKKLLPKVGGEQMEAISVNTSQDLSDTPSDLLVKINQTSDGRFRVGVGAGESRRAETFNTREQAQAWADEQIANANSGRRTNQPGFDVTPAMQDKVKTTGLPRFSLRSGKEVPTIGPKIDGTYLKRIQNIREQIGNEYTSGKITFDEFQKRYDETNKEYVDALVFQKKLDESKPATSLEEVFPGFVSIPVGTKVLATWSDLHPSPTQATVVGARDVRVGTKAYKFPVVDFNDGKRARTLTREDIKEVYAPRKFSLRYMPPQATQDAVKRITTTREEKGFVKRMMEAIAPKSASHFRQANLNRYNQHGVYDKMLAKQMGVSGLLADVSSEAAALQSDVGAGLTASALGVHDHIGGVPVYQNGYTSISNLNNTVSGPMDFFVDLLKAGKNNDFEGKGTHYIYQLWQFWAGAKRAKRFLDTGEEVLYTKDDIKYAKQLEQEYPEFKEIHKKWIKYNDGLVKYMLDTGVISEEGAKKFIEHADYIPFYRQLDGEATIGPNIFQSISNVKPPRKIKHSEAPLADFMETVVRNTQSIIQAGIKNTAAQKAVNVALQLGPDFIVPLNYASSNPEVVVVLEKGLKKYYKSSDPLWIESTKSLNVADLPFNAIISGPANLLRTMVTKDPGFMLANMMRDSLAAYVTSGIKMTPIVDTIKNFSSAIAGQSPEFQKLLNAGILGGYDFSQNIEYSGRVLSKALRKKTGTTTTTEKVLSPFTGLWSALEKGAMASDSATREEVYKKTLAETGNEAEALFRAMEVMNFNRKGSSPIVRVVTAAIPFLNARIQGLDVLYRAGFGEINSANAAKIQKLFFMRAATIMALSSLYWFLTHDDDEYKKQEAETRDNYWLLPSLGIKIPIPFEIGILFKVIPERILAYSFGDDTGQDFVDSMTRQLKTTLMINPVPQTVLPALEAYTNKSFFTQRAIVGQGLEDVAPGYQVGPGTTNIAADIGKALNISPMKLDHMIKGYTGTMGMYMLEVVDSVYSMNSDIEKPSKRLDQMPVLKRFLIDPEARGTVTAYYEMKNAAGEAVRTSNLLERTFKFNDQMEYMQENGKMLVADEYVKTLEKTMKKFREMRGMIQSSNMSGDEKRDAIKQITAAENKLTSNIQAMKKALQ